MTLKKSILVLGVGNILYTDEGLGVRAVQSLEHGYIFSDNVRLLDGGTQGYLLMDAMISCETLIVLDAVNVVSQNARQNSVAHKVSSAGTIHILKGEDLRQSIAFSDSLHQTDLVDTLVLCELAGHRPDTIVIGMEPADYTSQSLSLTTRVAAQMPEFCTTVLKAIEHAGGQWQARI
ncbi:MAG: HyaD/HybD family hydrogenase maturation endopeptidase [Pseudomonadota bacterium]